MWQEENSKKAVDSCRILMPDFAVTASIVRICRYGRLRKPLSLFGNTVTVEKRNKGILIENSDSISSTAMSFSRVMCKHHRFGKIKLFLFEAFGHVFKLKFLNITIATLGLSVLYLFAFGYLNQPGSLSLRFKDAKNPMQICAQVYTILPSAVKRRCSSLLKEKTESTFGDLQPTYELLRYQSVKTAKDLWLVFSKKLDDLSKIALSAVSKEQAARLQRLIISNQKELDRISLSLLVNLEQLGRVDGKSAARIDGLNRLSLIVQSRIHELQNPQDCAKAKFLLADMSRPFGYGCQAHYLMYCLHMAYATGRTLLLQTKKGFGAWWAKYYEPFSYKCSMKDIVEGKTIPELDNTNLYSNSRLVRCVFGVFINSQNISIAPPAVPEDLVRTLRPLHGQPSVWFLGQLAHYIMRPRRNFQRQLDTLLMRYQFTDQVKRPIVGVHIRRTDKITWTEAKFHQLGEYMKHVKRYFDYIEEKHRMAARIQKWNKDVLPPERLEPYKLHRRVFLATDDPTVFKEAKENYPEYVFYGDPETARSAQVRERDKEYSRTNIALDVHLLSRTDYIVCTLSSHVCRVAYELMQTRHEDLGDSGSSIHSLDTSFFWDGGQTITCEMIFDDEDLHLHRGDVVPVWSGNINSFYERKRLMNKTYFMDTPYKCIPRLISAKMGNYS